MQRYASAKSPNPSPPDPEPLPDPAPGPFPPEPFPPPIPPRPTKPPIPQLELRRHTALVAARFPSGWQRRARANAPRSCSRGADRECSMVDREGGCVWTRQTKLISSAPGSIRRSG